MAHHLKIRYSEEFRSVVCEITSGRVVRHLKKLIAELQAFPGMGSTYPRKVLKERYGNDIRTVPVEGYLLVYRYDEEALWLITLVWGGLVK